MFGWITRRRVLISLVALSALFGSALILATLALRAGYLERLVVVRVQNKLAEYGVRLEVGSLQSKFRGLSFEARDLRAYVGEATQPFATVRKVTGTLSLRDILGFSGPTEVHLNTTEIEGLRARYHIDVEGRSNLDGLHPSTNTHQRFSIDYKSATITVRDAEVLYLDRLHKIDGAARDVALTLTPAVGGAMHLVASSRQSQLEYDGRSTKGLDVDLVALLRETGANIESLKLQSPYLNASLKGVLNSWHEFDYQLESVADLNLREFGEFLAPNMKLAGAARFTGQVSGTGIDYRVSGELHGERLMARDVRLNGIKVTAEGVGKGSVANGKLNVAVNALAAAGFQINRFSAVGEIDTTDALFDWRGRLKAATLSSGGLRVTDVSIDRAQLRGPFRELSQANLKGALTIGSLVTADVVIGSLHGEVKATPDVVELPSFNGVFFGGIGKGSARLALNRSSQSQLIAEVTGVDVDQTIAAALGNRLPLRGKAEAQVHVNWRGTDVESADGAAHISFDGSALGPQEGVGRHSP
jgi:hypothetical protein